MQDPSFRIASSFWSWMQIQKQHGHGKTPGKGIILRKTNIFLTRQSCVYYRWSLCRQFHASSTTWFLIALWGSQVLLCFDLEICERANRPVYIPYQRANSRQVLIASTQCQFNRWAREKQRLYDTAACICMGLFLPMTRRFLLDLFSLKITVWSHELQFLI